MSFHEMKVSGEQLVTTVCNPQICAYKKSRLSKSQTIEFQVKSHLICSFSSQKYYEGLFFCNQPQDYYTETI